MPTLPLTQLDDGAPSAELDNRSFTLTFAQPAPIQEVLLTLVRGTNLSIVPDPAITGSFIGDLKQVTVRQALGLVLPALGLDYSVDGSFIRVFRRQPETRILDLNYIATERIGTSSIGGTGGPDGQSSAAVSSSTRADVFADLANGVRALLSERATFNVDRKAGLLQVTDFPERLDRVAVYLDAVQDRVHRQAQIDARVIEVELNDEKSEGIDWSLLAGELAGRQTGQRPPRRALMGLRVTDVTRLLQLLAAQGRVVTLASPRLLTLNNEPAIVSTDAMTLSVTPQIGSDAVVTLSLGPFVKDPMRAQSDMIARVGDGETLVISGFTRAQETRERKSVGVSGGGWFGRSTVVTHKHRELVILLTPRIVSGVMAQ